MERIRPPRGFAATDLAALIVLAAVVGALVLISGSDHRRLARLGEDISHLKELGAATGQYQADNADLFWTFSWRHGQVYQTQYPDLNDAGDDVQAAANQAVYILRTRTGRADLIPIQFWIPHFYYSHLALLDYLGGGLPNRAAISSEDRARLLWSSDPSCFDAGCFECQPEPTFENFRWPYSGSFMPGLAFFDQSLPPYRLVPSGYNTYITNGVLNVMGAASLAAVAFPSQKVLLMDQNARHFGSRQPYCTHEQARLPLLMVDASVPVRSAADANLGWNPNTPNSPTGLTLSYAPSNCWEPAPLLPGGDFAYGRFRYTRHGIAGRDFGGPEAP